MSSKCKDIDFQIIDDVLMYRFLSSGFSYPAHSVISEIKKFIEDYSGEKEYAGKRYSSYMGMLKKYLKKVKPDIVQAEYNNLFSSNALCPSRESSWKPSSSRVHLLADIAGFYGAFGFELSEISDTPDSIAVELEFISILCAKRSYAKQTGLAENEALCADAQRKFLSEHLGWEKVFCDRLNSVTSNTFYKILAKITTQFIDDQMKYFAVKPMSMGKSLIVDDRNCFGCGIEDDVYAK